MRLLELRLHEVGPFNDAQLRFLDASDDPRRVAFITGQNGTGKTILLDAIRWMFGHTYHQGSKLRAIHREAGKSHIEFELDLLDGNPALKAWTKQPNWPPSPQSILLWHLPALMSARGAPPWVLQYWKPTQPSDAFEITSFGSIDHSKFLTRALAGDFANADATRLICFFDYLRDSHDPREKLAGELLYAAMEKIVRASLLEGRLVSVKRSTFMPMIEQSGQTVPLSGISSGNAYLIQRMISLLGMMYSSFVLRDLKPEDLLTTPGLLLIDEAENHLHPIWQKRLIRNILDVFPNLQIIATTHSPFIVASYPGARVFVCRYDSARHTCVVDDETRRYDNQPINEILASPAFDETWPFSQTISELMDQRRAAIANHDDALRKQIEEKLKESNPDYFSYLDIEERLHALDRADEAPNAKS